MSDISKVLGLSILLCFGCVLAGGIARTAVWLFMLGWWGPKTRDGEIWITLNFTEGKSKVQIKELRRAMRQLEDGEKDIWLNCFPVE